MKCPYCGQNIWLSREDFEVCQGCGYKVAKAAKSTSAIQKELEAEMYAEMWRELAAGKNPFQQQRDEYSYSRALANAQLSQQNLANSLKNQSAYERALTTPMNDW